MDEEEGQIGKRFMVSGWIKEGKKLFRSTAGGDDASGVV